MGNIMKAKITRIGNSKGIRIPAKLLKECDIKDVVNISTKGNSIIITPTKESRKGWGEAAINLMRTQNEILHIPDDIINEEAS